MKSLTGLPLLLFALGSATVAAGSAHDGYFLESPDGTLKISINLPVPGSTNTPVWSATFLGKQILTNCNLGLRIRDEGELTKGARLQRERRRSLNKRIPVLF